jgi:serine protease Do
MNTYSARIGVSYLFISVCLAVCGMLVVLAAEGSSTTPPNEAVPVEASVAASSVYVSVGDDAHGSGFVIKPGLIITAKHVVEKSDPDKLTVRMHSRDGDFEVPAKVVWTGGGAYDVALLEADTRSVPALPMSCEKMHVGQRVLTHGAPKFLVDVTTYGHVAGFAVDKDVLAAERDAVIVDITIYPGNSGGPVVDRDTGLVVGIANAVMLAAGGGFLPPVPSGHAFVLPSTAICRMFAR